MGSYSLSETSLESDGASECSNSQSEFGLAEKWAADRIGSKVRGTAHDGQLLERAIRNEIIPRLMMVHAKQSARGAAADQASTTIREPEVREFVTLLLFSAEQPAFTSMAFWRQSGTPIETLYLNLLAPAARMLGDYWTDDLCDFTEVTVALGRLQRMLNSLGHELEQSRQVCADSLSILLASAPGEQHTFGLAMVGEFFRQDGWEVCGGPGATTADAIALVKTRKVDAIGFSIAGEGHLDALAKSISLVRKAANSRAPCIIVGGPLLALHPEYFSKVGADLLAVNGKDAPCLARQLVLANQTVG